MIDKKDPAQMIDLMFDADRFNTGADLFVNCATLILEAEAHPSVAFQIRGIIRKAHTSFLSGLGIPFFEDHRIDEDQTMGPRITRGNIYNRDGLGHADLRRSDPDSMRLTFHRANHPCHKFQERTVKLNDRQRFLPQNGIWKNTEGRGFHHS